MLHKPDPLAAEIARIAPRQHGVVTLADLRRLGASRSTVALWVRTGHLHRLHRGVFSVPPPSMLTVEGHWLAAVRAGGPNAFLCGPTAGQLQWLLDRRERFAIHVAVRGRSARRIPGVLIHRPRSLPPRDTTTYLKIPTTTPTRTVWDLASHLSPLRLQRVFEKAEQKGKLHRGRLGELLEASPNLKGASMIRSLLARPRRPAAEVRSELEELFREICSEHDVPLPVSNAPLLGYEVDFLWEDARVVVEADGSDHLTPSQRDRDNERDAVLARAGYLVRRYSDVAMADRAAVARELLAILRERGVLR